MNPIMVALLSLEHKFPTRETKKQDIQNLLKALYPVKGGRELMRLGGTADGGYLVPDCLDGIEACFSPGVAGISRFEADCADRGMDVFMADYSVDGPAEDHPKFHFLKKFVGATTNEKVITLQDWVSQSAPSSDSDLLLQMDIEGSEYETLLAAPDSLMKRFRIIVGEFHRLNQLWNYPLFPILSHTFEKILQTHVCVHIHPNNGRKPFNKKGISISQTTEFTFLRKDFVSDTSYVQSFPHPLDADNSANRSVVLPTCWYAPKSR